MNPDRKIYVKANDVRLVLRLAAMGLPCDDASWEAFARLAAAQTRSVKGSKPIGVHLHSYPEGKKIDLIKIIRKHAGLGLAEAKDYSELPLPINLEAEHMIRGWVARIPKENLTAFVNDLRAIGCSVR